MPKIPTNIMPPLNLGDETLGPRLARLRKERGYTQLDLAKKTGIIRELISDYERERLRPHYENIIRLALALEVSTDELLGVSSAIKQEPRPNPKILRRLKKIEALPTTKQKTLLQNIDMFLKGAKK